MDGILDSLAMKYNARLIFDSINFQVPAGSVRSVVVTIKKGWSAYFTQIGGYSSQDSVNTYLEDMARVKRWEWTEWPDTFVWWNARPLLGQFGRFSGTTVLTTGGDEGTWVMPFTNDGSVVTDINLSYHMIAIKNEHVDAFERELKEIANIPANLSLIAYRLKFLEDFVRALK